MRSMELTNEVRLSEVDSFLTTFKEIQQKNSGSGGGGWSSFTLGVQAENAEKIALFKQLVDHSRDDFNNKLN